MSLLEEPLFSEGLRFLPPCLRLELFFDAFLLLDILWRLSLSLGARCDALELEASDIEQFGVRGCILTTNERVVIELFKSCTRD